eukprot:TRINITY_DN2194_c0_g1_i1.p1 TRINITY_DN2194_c0_g1~~TRINITY_DN2194_c0_g1_i1.p1  ORF type:complete len:519 (-),score=118.16 TRINITY_DN2194_c0_g1_i1:962-2518(-)
MLAARDVLPPPPLAGNRMGSQPAAGPVAGPSAVWGWSRLEPSLDNGGQPAPCQRSLHVAVVLEDKMYIFGGYDGSNRVNDFYEFDIPTRRWSIVSASGTPPSPRDRHTGVIHGSSFYVFAGFDGAQRVNDFFAFNFGESKWSPVQVLSGVAPSPRHSHAAVVYGSSMFVFGGYDGSYRSDFHEYNFATCGWSLVSAAGRVPRARYRATCVVQGGCMYLFGGHDGTRHLNDVHVFEFEPRVWMTLNTENPAPIPRDSHVSVIHGRSMYVFGGSTGSAMNDFYELRLDTCKWSPVQALGNPPNHRFCHVACVCKDSMLVFGGYDGTNRLNDLLEFKFGADLMCCDIPPSTLVEDLKGLVDNELLSDITFMVEGQPVYAHKILCMRCTYFRAMLTGSMVESRAKEVVLEDVRRPIFLALLQYLYTDEADIALDDAMELFQVPMLTMPMCYTSGNTCVHVFAWRCGCGARREGERLSGAAAQGRRCAMRTHVHTVEADIALDDAMELCQVHVLTILCMTHLE